MDINQAFGKALREIRLTQGLSQESMPEAASRVYVSLLERGLRNPSLLTVNKISDSLDIHPLVLLMKTYMLKDDLDPNALKNLIDREIS